MKSRIKMIKRKKEDWCRRIKDLKVRNQTLTSFLIVFGFNETLNLNKSVFIGCR